MARTKHPLLFHRHPRFCEKKTQTLNTPSPPPGAMKPLLQLLESANSCDELLSCLFGLNALESRLYLTLSSEEMEVRPLAELVGKERSVVYRALQKLIACNLCKKKKRLLPKGGYFFVYSAIPPEEVKEDILAKLEGLNRHIRSSLEDFEKKVEEQKAKFKKTRALSTP